MNNTIQIYGRVRPTRKKQKLTADKYYLDVHDEGKTTIGFHIPREIATINNQRESYQFLFDKVFDTTSEQEEIFDVVAKPVIERLLKSLY
jgi:kinesin family protein 6/9